VALDPIAQGGSTPVQTYTRNGTLFTPEQIMKLGPALVSSPQTAHVLHLKQQPMQCTIPLLISTMHVVGLETLADATGKITDDYFYSYARNEPMPRSSNNNNSSIAPVGQSAAPPRKHATRKKHQQRSLNVRVTPGHNIARKSQPGFS
jgi:hypothetical protein